MVTKLGAVTVELNQERTKPAQGLETVQARLAKLAASPAIPNDAMLELLALPIELLALPGIEPLNRFEIVRSSSPLLSGRPVQISFRELT